MVVIVDSNDCCWPSWQLRGVSESGLGNKWRTFTTNGNHSIFSYYITNLILYNFTFVKIWRCIILYSFCGWSSYPWLSHLQARMNFLLFFISFNNLFSDLNALGCFVNLFFPKVSFISTSDVMFKAMCSNKVNTVIYHCTAFNSSDTSVGCYKTSLILTVHNTCCTAVLTSLRILIEKEKKKTPTMLLAYLSDSSHCVPQVLLWNITRHLVW